MPDSSRSKTLAHIDQTLEEGGLILVLNSSPQKVKLFAKYPSGDYRQMGLIQRIHVDVNARSVETIDITLAPEDIIAQCSTPVQEGYAESMVVLEPHVTTQRTVRIDGPNAWERLLREDLDV